MSLEFNDTNFDESIKSGIAVIDFWAPWCGPCKMMSPVIDKIANNNPDLIVAKVNIDASPGVATKYNILSIPTVIIYKNGEPAEQIVGVASEKVIMEKVNSLK